MGRSLSKTLKKVSLLSDSICLLNTRLDGALSKYCKGMAILAAPRSIFVGGTGIEKMMLPLKVIKI